jgi:predicted nuclease of predicted toxin-antitoxin system
MKFLLDQSTDARLGSYLTAHGHDATRIGAEYPSGLPDLAVLAIATREKRILITDDRDFGALVFLANRPHAGVIYLRLGSYAALSVKQARLGYVLTHYATQLDQFLVVTVRRVRIRAQQRAQRASA